ncbi:YraN family protein [Candidatus Dependentiae bacterium]|nr:YraN family protein [Candidatus Dependentiae bacterium]MBU4386914.1 YraN family protein [Candidatus Dependentiae bacterium]MCG2756391.1 YraN family protein [Candidatus Dependentiae bacterium]
MDERTQLGILGEQAVADYLKKQNFKIVNINYKTRYGEIDIIAQKDEYLLFVEVKTRINEYFPISNVITYTKQRKIINTAKLFIQINNIFDKVCRFDVATAILKNNKFDINYIENAFQDY